MAMLGVVFIKKMGSNITQGCDSPDHIVNIVPQEGIRHDMT